MSRTLEHSVMLGDSKTALAKIGHAQRKRIWAARYSCLKKAIRRDSRRSQFIDSTEKSDGQFFHCVHS